MGAPALNARRRQDWAEFAGLTISSRPVPGVWASCRAAEKTEKAEAQWAGGGEAMHAGERARRERRSATSKGIAEKCSEPTLGHTPSRKRTS